MRAAVSMDTSTHQQDFGRAMADGLSKHGVVVQLLGADLVEPRADFHVIWCIKRPRILEWARTSGTPVLVMERGHLPDQMRYTSCGWNGLGRQARYAMTDDGGARWRCLWGGLMRPWRPGGRYALLCGQVDGDAALWGLPDYRAWVNQTAEAMRVFYMLPVRYRPHPAAWDRGDSWQPNFVHFSIATLREDLAGAHVAVTYNSTVGVDAVLAGVPTVTLDDLAMAWQMAAHQLEAPLIRPDRIPWAHRLAWTSFTIEEIQSGFAWEHVQTAMPQEVGAHG